MKPLDRDALFRTMGEGMGAAAALEAVTLVNVSGSDALGEAVAAAAAANARIRRVSLESNAIGEQGLLALAEVLRASTSLLELRLTNQKGGVSTAAAEALVAAVEANGVTTVCAFEVRDRSLALRLDAALRRNVDAVRAQRHSTSVADGSFRPVLNAVQRQIAAVAAGEGPPEGLRFADSREFRNLSAAWRGPRLFDALTASRAAVPELDCSGCGLDTAWAVGLAEALPTVAGLSVVNLARNSIGGEGVMAIAAALPGTTVTRLRLNDQKGVTMGSQAEEAMAAAVAAAPSLVSLNLDWRSQQHRQAADRNISRNMDAARVHRRNTARA